MKKEILIFLILLAVVSGCDLNNEDTPDTGTPFLGGTTGLIMNFMEDAPPEEVYDGGEYPFDIVVKLENEGEWDVEAGNARVKISGIDPSEFGLDPSDLIGYPDSDLTRTYKDAEGNVIEGSETHVGFYGFNFQDEIRGNMQFPVRADVCYTYGTNALSQICIKEDLYDTDEDSLCIVNEEKSVYSSRAPVQVTSMKESVRGAEKVGFTFTLEHIGNGGIFQKGSDCDTTGVQYEKKVWIEVSTGEEGLKCNGLQDGTDTTGYVTLYGGERTVTCTQEADSVSDYQKKVDITIEYDYKDDIDTVLLLKHTQG